MIGRQQFAGTLMEVVSHMWLEDGRLLILAVGLCRIKVCSAHFT